MKKENKKNVKRLVITAIFIFIFIALLKFIPMDSYGQNIKFDASLHLSATIFILYSLWIFFWKRNFSKTFLAIAIVSVAVVSFQRIYVGAHDLFGLVSGFLLSAISIVLAESFSS